VQTSIGSPARSLPQSVVAAFLTQQYAELAEEMRTQGLSGAIFTELGGYEQELGIVSYDRRVYTIPPDVVRQLNESLIAASEDPGDLLPGPAAIPPGTTGLWEFDEGRGTAVQDASGNGHTLSLQGGAGWTQGIRGSALAISAPGQSAVATTPVIDTSHSFTVSAWLSSGRPGQSGSAVSEPGTDGSSFSLGIDTASQGAESLSGEVGTRKVLSLGDGTWWTFAVPARATCPASMCGVRANMHYDDGRFDPAVGSWHQVTGVYDGDTQTITVYVDGVPEDVEHVTGVPAASGPLTVGAGLDDYQPSDTFLGAIDELRTYGRALDPVEVWALYRAELPAG
jgi:hypothetical protein